MDPTSYYYYNVSGNEGGGGLIGNRDNNNDNSTDWIGCENYLSYFTPISDVDEMMLGYTQPQQQQQQQCTVDFADFYNDTQQQQQQMLQQQPMSNVNERDLDFLMTDLATLEHEAMMMIPQQQQQSVVVDGDIMQQWLSQNPTIDIFSGGGSIASNGNNEYSSCMINEYSNNNCASNSRNFNKRDNNNNNNKKNTTTTTTRSSKNCPQECPICHKILSRDLPRHMRTHEDQGRFKCPFPRSLCPHKRGQFNRQYDFKKHLLHCHFNFDTSRVKSFHDLGSKLDCSGVCKCGVETTGEEWLETHILNGVFKCPLLHNNNNNNNNININNHDTSHSII